MSGHTSTAPALAPRVAPSEAQAFAGSSWFAAGASAAANAPYLARLMRVRGELLVDLDEDWPTRVLGAAIRTADDIALCERGVEESMRLLRRAKQDAHLAIALADLAGAWRLEEVTGGLTAFADASVRAALAVAARDLVARGELAPAALGQTPGFALIAMGKMGAHELNYSSDIDVSAFYDASLLPVGAGREARVVAVRMVAPFARVLQEQTADGYVFRTDLRLRPDPGSTPAAVSIASAEHYYQTLGQNWERAAFIKARAAGGDLACGRAFLESLIAFVWRKHLDFAAVADVQSIKRQILSTHGGAELSTPVFDVKLGRGGIRDIELFAQTQQLILGGRNRALRAPTTMGALAALAESGHISEDARAGLSEAYTFYRAIEHRAQMLEDAQTHDIPRDPEARARLAALSGIEDLDAFDRAVIERRARVADIDFQLFGAAPSLADPLGSLVFTGVEDDSETLKTIARLGYSEPRSVSEAIRGWHHGRIRAMRSERARELLTALTPRLLRALADSGEPDAAFARFATFFAGLNAGVQVLSLMTARPKLLDDLARLFGLAPRLAQLLAQRPALIDAMIEPRFSLPLAEDGPGARLAELAARLGGCETFEQTLNEARRYQRDEAFRIGVQVLAGGASAQDAGAAHADLAEACVITMAQAARAEVSRTAGAAPGDFVVLALGKFGGRELAERSDLDIMVIYDGPEGGASSGPTVLSVSEYFTRFTQRLISALSAPTEEGMLYDTDMQLRPSGSKGPVAVRMSSFARYYEEEAWTWELLALTRARVVAGGEGLCARVAAVIAETMGRAKDDRKILADAADMRARMARERRAGSAWDLKLAPGGLVDIEFIAQSLMLIWAARGADVVRANTGAALDRLLAAGALAPQAHEALASAWRLQSDLTQALRVVSEGAFAAENAPAALRERLAALGGAPSFDALEANLAARQLAVRAVFEQIFSAGDGVTPPVRSTP